ncbi:ALF repeat-containing protein, partial [Saccharothrix sp. NPDC042600]|uniref:ALF repeat-containing protein n=1 Tax=Saccharothrix sp. NPDC042600 TaxID=3154492 RepID=UPI0033CE8DCD
MPAWRAGTHYRPDPDTQTLLDHARHTTTPADTALVEARTAALRLWRHAGPYTAHAAEQALTGDHTALTTFLTAGLDTALAQDDRLGVKILGGNADTAAALTAAQKALATGTPEQVEHFLHIGGDYDGRDDEDRIAVQRILNTGGPATKDAANAALDGSIDDVRDFLAVGRDIAAQDDDRIATQLVLNTGGPEVRAAANAALDGPWAGVRQFLRLGRYQAARRDAETAHHVAVVTGHVAAAAASAATARHHAALAAHTA